MKIKTFDDDLLGGLKDFAERLEQFIAIEHHFVDGSLVIGLNSKFGSGKSTFLRMWENSLKSTQEDGDGLQVIMLNAWESDYYGDPLFAIISALVNCGHIKERSTNRLMEAAKDLGWFATAIGGQVTKAMTGIDPIAAGETAEKKKKSRETKSNFFPDTFSVYEHRRNAMDSLKNAIRELVEGNLPKILFLVDELDRCRPDYAISYLETIKHIFDIKGAVFILAVDRRQLENSARATFGIDLNFEEYYRKFVHREVTLSATDDKNYQHLIFQYVKYYLSHEEVRNCYMCIDNDRIKNVSELIGALKLTFRQIQEIFRILGHLLQTGKENAGTLRWCLSVGSIMMSALKVGNPKIYTWL